MKKAVAALLACLLAVATVACDGNRDKDWTVADDYEDGKLIINLFGHDLDDLQSPSKDTQAILDIVENKFGIRFKITTTVLSSAPTLLNQLIAGGDVPDLFIHFKNEPSYSGWIDSQYLMDYGPYLDSYPNLKRAFGALGTEKEVKSYLNGEYYSYPIIIHSDTQPGELTAECGMFYRRDWYQALADKNWQPSSGRPLLDPENPDFNYLNFYDLMEGFTNGDPDGNNKADTYGYSLCKDAGVFWWYPLLNMFNASIDGWYKDAQGVWQPENISDNMYQAVMFVADMYDAGFINPDYSTTTTFEAAKNNYVNGKAGAVVSNVTGTMGSGIVDMMKNFLGQVAGSTTMLDVVRGMPVVTGKDGVKRVLGALNNYGYLAINNDITDNKKQKILSFLDWVLSEEGDTLLTWGIEGTHYETASDNTKRSLLGKDSNGNQKTLVDNTIASGIYRLKGLVSWETPFTNDPRPYPDVVDQLLSAWDQKDMIIDELTFVNVDSSFATVKAALHDDTAKAFKSIVANISGSSEQKKAKRDEIWNKFVAAYKLKGSNYFASINQNAKELYA